jgi:hypothetical protein
MKVPTSFLQQPIRNRQKPRHRTLSRPPTQTHTHTEREKDLDPVAGRVPADKVLKHAAGIRRLECRHVRLQRRCLPCLSARSHKEKQPRRLVSTAEQLLLHDYTHTFTSFFFMEYLNAGANFGCLRGGPELGEHLLLLPHHVLSRAQLCRKTGQ